MRGGVAEVRGEKSGEKPVIMLIESVFRTPIAGYES
jgi:hypothetical protein